MLFLFEGLEIKMTDRVSILFVRLQAMSFNGSFFSLLFLFILLFIESSVNCFVIVFMDLEGARLTTMNHLVVVLVFLFCFQARFTFSFCLSQGFSHRFWIVLLWLDAGECPS